MLWPFLVLTQALAELIAFPVPGGRTVWTDPALAPGLAVLADLQDGRPLVAALARGGVQVELARERLERWAEYDHEL